MGLLTEGSPLSWEETKQLADYVREHGVTQFINLYKRLKDRQGDVLKWGDEVEYILVKFDHEKQEAKVDCRLKATSYSQYVFVGELTGTGNLAYFE